MGWVLLKGGFSQIQVHLCISLSLSGAACQPGNGGMWVVCHLCQEPWILALLSEATRGNHWKVSESDLPQSHSQ